MSKTEMTKKIEEAVLSWHPDQIGDIKINKFRKEHTALEVVAEHGANDFGRVDAVRVSEYFGDIERKRICDPPPWRKGEDFVKYAECRLNLDKPPATCEETSCIFNRCMQIGSPKILITCFEIKVTKSDFKSKHGHNFIGNMNYYCVPEEIYKDIEPLVPPDIGILSYLHRGMYIGLRSKRKPQFKEMDTESQMWLILSVFNRCGDMDFERHWDQMADLRKSYEGIR